MDGQTVNIGLVLAAGTILVLTLFSAAIRSRLWVSEPMICLAVGVAAGPYALDAFSIDVMREEDHRLLLEQVARLTVSLSVMSAALRLPDGFVRGHWRSLAIVLTLGMGAMWAVSAGLSLLLPGVSVLTALLIGAVVTPTDPVLSAGIVRGRTADADVRAGTRHAITAESGINDGFALPFVLLPILFLTRPGGEVWGHFLGHVVLWEVVGAACLGFGLGWLTGRALAVCRRLDVTTPRSVTAVTLALTLATLAGARLMGTDGILAVFTAGLALKVQLEEDDDDRSEHFEEVIDRFFTLPVFILLGVALPWNAWIELGPILPVFALLAVLLRRPPAWLGIGRLAPFYETRRSAGLAGWFGPIGVAAVFYAMLAVERTDQAVVWPAVSAVVVLSILIHGASAVPLTKRYGDAR